ncbi:MAG: RluA family pseudouridine synthase [Gammaproteobacteria bacterium]|nr:RluA family pseudouridine synthase [Gammaproteobacteria bacterium]
MSLIQPLTYDASLPERIPSPFASQAHPLAQHAAQLLQQQLARLAIGENRMFGVLVVRHPDNSLGYLSAFEGTTLNHAEHDLFVPAIFSAIDQRRAQIHNEQQQQQCLQAIALLHQDPEFLHWQQQRDLWQQQRQTELQALHDQHQHNKINRDAQRAALDENTETYDEQLRLIAQQSQQDRRVMKARQRHWQQQLSDVEAALLGAEQQLQQWQLRLNKLQAQQHTLLIDLGELHNRSGNKRGVASFFAGQTIPHTAGECAATKLLNFANQHQLTPIALSEFWWGPSDTNDEIRHHRQHYPCCRSRCHVLLPFLLDGLAVESAPVHVDNHLPAGLDILFEDDELVIINKPAGLLSVPGTDITDSVQQRLWQTHPDQPLLLHRLDLATSGLLLAAKNSRCHKLLQRQFVQHTLQKRYVALLDRRLADDVLSGDINLPMRVNLLDRPRQMVCYNYGKPALTHWQVIDRDDRSTRVHFFPQTGRTHQLRVHAAHAHGLNAPIIGDDLYGRPGPRLMLHAQQLQFIHPTTGQQVCIEAPSPF